MEMKSSSSWMGRSGEVHYCTFSLHHWQLGIVRTHPKLCPCRASALSEPNICGVLLAFPLELWFYGVHKASSGWLSSVGFKLRTLWPCLSSIQTFIRDIFLPFASTSFTVNWNCVIAGIDEGCLLCLRVAFSFFPKTVNRAIIAHCENCKKEAWLGGEKTTLTQPQGSGMLVQQGRLFLRQVGRACCLFGTRLRAVQSVRRIHLCCKCPAFT